jgi:integrase
MAIKKLTNGWQVDSQPGGRGAKRFRKTFDTQAEAKRYEAWLKSQVTQNAKWQPDKRDKRMLSELVELCYEHHGIGLKAGQETLRSLRALCIALSNPRADEFSAEMFTRYRAQRLEAGTSANSLNHEHAYLRSVFNELTRLGLWKRGNPLKLLRPFKLEERELSYLTLNQVETLLRALDGSKNLHLGLIARVCLSTGARWGEAEELKIGQIRDGVIQYARTKSGRVRAVPITQELDKLLKTHHVKH